MARWGALTGAKLAIGLGGALDVFAGNVDRAPEKWRRMGLEWAYQMCIRDRTTPQPAAHWAALSFQTAPSRSSASALLRVRL